MTFRSYLQKLEKNGELITIKEPISKTYEIAATLKALRSDPALAGYPVVFMTARVQQHEVADDGKAKQQEASLKAIAKPAEGLPWHKYRKQYT